MFAVRVGQRQLPLGPRQREKQKLERYEQFGAGLGGANVDPDRIVDAMTETLQREFGADPGRMPLQAIVFETSRR